MTAACRVDGLVVFFVMRRGGRRKPAVRRPYWLQRVLSSKRPKPPLRATIGQIMYQADRLCLPYWLAGDARHQTWRSFDAEELLFARKLICVPYFPTLVCVGALRKKGKATKNSRTKTDEKSMVWWALVLGAYNSWYSYESNNKFSKLSLFVTHCTFACLPYLDDKYLF